jgi:hypothetical protein
MTATDAMVEVEEREVSGRRFWVRLPEATALEIDALIERSGLARAQFTPAAFVLGVRQLALMLDPERMGRAAFKGMADGSGMLGAMQKGAITDR